MERMEPLARASDEELLRLMLAGDEEVFSTLYRRRKGVPPDQHPAERATAHVV
jgi:hypothetical protein